MGTSNFQGLWKFEAKVWIYLLNVYIYKIHVTKKLAPICIYIVTHYIKIRAGLLTAKI